MSDDGLITFLRARLAEDEAVARQAAGLLADNVTTRPSWTYDRHRFQVRVDETTWIAAKETGDAGGNHIARHDPARVLREVEAKRSIVSAYERWHESKTRHTRAAAELDAETEHQERTGEWAGAGLPDVRLRAIRREADYLDAMQPTLEGLVRAIAAVYDDHPGYRQEWRTR